MNSTIMEILGIVAFVGMLLVIGSIPVLIGIGLYGFLSPVTFWERLVAVIVSSVVAIIVGILEIFLLLILAG